MPQDADLQYLIRVQDSQLRELMRNLREVNKEIARSEGVSTKAGAGVTRSYAQVDAAAGRSLKSIAKTAGAVGVGVVAADTGAAFLKGAIREGTNLAEQVSKTRVLFGQSADGILAWSETTASAIGTAKVEALEATGTFGAMLIPLGLAPEKAAKLSRELVHLGADLASFNNASPVEIFAAIRSGIAGEAEPLRRRGILLSEARVQHVALAQSGKDVVSALTSEEKVLARIAIIQQDAAAARGDFARTSENLANQERILAANIKDLQSKLGTVLIPTLVEGVSAVNDLLEGLEHLAALKDIAVRVEVLVEKLSPNFLPDIVGPIGESVTRSVLLGPALGPLSLLMGKIRDDAEETAEGLGSAEKSARGIADAVAKAEIETKLRTRLGAALEDVHEKALKVFDAETDALVDGHDKVTNSLLDAFDRTTDEMLERMKAVVHVGERQFEIGRGELTPAERELEALEKVDRTRNLKRETLDAKDALSQALIVGDPEQIREAKRRLEDAEAERKKIKVEGRAKTERDAADKALAEEERQLSESRSKQRDALAESRRDLRDDLAERRRIQHENLDAALKAQEEALKKGKKKAAEAQRQILATLRKFGVEYEGVGAELGGKFLEGFLSKIRGSGKKEQKTPLLLLPGTIDPKTGQVVPLFKPKGAARGGIAGQLGTAGPSDTLPAWLTPGEMILTSADQRRLAQKLGTRSVGWPLLSQIRMGFAQGGVADDELFRMLLERFSHSLRDDALERIHGGRGLASNALLTGRGLTDAQRKMLSPIHVWAKVKNATTAGQRAKLGPDRLRTLYAELAQRQAHPGRSGLIRYVGGEGVVGGGRFGDPWRGSGTSMNFGDIHASFPNVHDGYEAFEEMRGLFLRQQRRNPRRRRGRNKERGL